MYNDGGGGWWPSLFLTGMLKIHLSVSSIKVNVPRPLLYKRSFNSTSVLFKDLGCTAQSPGSILCHDSEKGVKSLV